MKVKVLWIVTQGSGARPCSNAPWSCGCLSSLQRPCPHSKSFGGGSCRQVKHLNLSQHFFGTLIHQLTQTNNLLVTVNRCQEESVCLTIHSVLPTRPFIFFPCQLGELHNLLHLWGEVPPSAAAACGQLSRIPQQNTFHPPAGAAQFRGFPPKTKRRGELSYVCRRWSWQSSDCWHQDSSGCRALACPGFPATGHTGYAETLSIWQWMCAK